ncbi:MAG: hypothetical protein GX847_11205, partial [Clostridiales bacterium]|nr:hypothetical protein [Clostridiales bacterium]
MKSNTKLMALLLALILTALLLSGCAHPSTTTSPSAPVSPESPADTSSASVSAELPAASSAERTVIDMAGRTVTLPAEIKSIGTFGAIGVLNGFIETMGAGDKLCNQGSPSFV